MSIKYLMAVAVLSMLGKFCLANTLSISVPVHTSIIKNNAGSDLKIEANNYYFTALYNSKTQSLGDVDIPFLVIQINSAITQYQMEISELTSRCDSGVLSPSTLLDGTAIHKGDLFSHIGFTQYDGLHNFNSHRIRISGLGMAQLSVENTCNGIVAVSIREQI